MGILGIGARGLRVLRRKGPRVFYRRVVGFAYRKSFRSLLPRIDYYVENDVRVRPRYLLDAWLLPYGVDPVRENGIVSSHEALTRPGESVVIVGGGSGITAVWAARIVGEDGHVTVYEGGRESVEEIQRVLAMNDVEDRCEVHHAVVGAERNVYGGDSTDAAAVRPEDLPECDVLELDCEGSEVDVLRALPFGPRVIIVELHPRNFTEEPAELVQLLSSRGYRVTHRFGHDGVPVSEEEFFTLLERDEVNGQKYIDSGARYPVVMALTRDDLAR